ncbi:MAG: Gfo/Idh/MocA family protein [Candidatus Limnocylindria bacterium]
MIGVGVVGAGHAARIQLRGWGAVPNARVVGLWDRTPERGRALADEFGVRCFEELDALVEDPAVVAVDVATALETHLEHVRRAANARRHVLCQKPLAETYPAAEALVAACAAAGVRLMVNENWRWRPWYRAIRGVIDGGSLGALFHLRLTFRKSMAVVTPDRPPERIFEHQPFLRHMRPLVLLELGPHHLDVVRYLFGDPHTVYARTHKVTSVVDGEEVATVLLGYPDRTAVVELSWASVGFPGEPNPDTLSLEGTDGTLRLTPEGAVNVIYRDGRRIDVPVDLDDAIQRSWTAALAHFADAIERSGPFETDGSYGLATHRAVLAAYRSAASGLPMPLVEGQP